MSSRSTSMMAWKVTLCFPSMNSAFSDTSVIRLSTLFLKSTKASATAAFRAIIALAQLASEPTARNSKRLPVKANGLVRLRSVLSMSSSGISGMSSSILCLPATVNKSSLSAFSICSSSSLTCLPKKLEMMAGGASLAPRRCALVALMILAFSKPLWR